MLDGSSCNFEVAGQGMAEGLEIDFAVFWFKKVNELMCGNCGY